MMELRLGTRIKSEVMAHRQLCVRCSRLFGMVTMSMAISACAVQTQRTTAIPPLENQPHIEIENVDLLGVSASMKRFIGNYAPKDMANGRKAWNLAYAALDPILLNFDYDPSLTLTAADTFNRRAGNCLSFSNMFIAMAREAGLKAWFQEVKLPPNGAVSTRHFWSACMSTPWSRTPGQNMSSM